MAKEQPDLLGAVLQVKKPFAVVNTIANFPFLPQPPYTFDYSAYLPDLRYLDFLIHNRVFSGAEIVCPMPVLFRVEVGDTARVIALEIRNRGSVRAPIFLFPAHHTAAIAYLFRFDAGHPLPDRQHEEEDSLRRFLYI